jgi:antitoxin (DNA-binding transcriptional repressor) of toxin-antitoxin stability system
MKRIIQAGVFKAKCLKLMDEVNKSKKTITVTKHKIPIVKIIPIIEEKPILFGKMKGTAQIKGDIIKPIDEIWNADL